MRRLQVHQVLHVVSQLVAPIFLRRQISPPGHLELVVHQIIYLPTLLHMHTPALKALLLKPLSGFSFPDRILHAGPPREECLCQERRELLFVV